MIEDVDGNTFLDFAAGIAVVATGHCHPRSRRRHPEAGRRPDSHVRHGFLLRRHGRAGRKACVDRARQGAQARLFRKFRHRGHRSGDEAGPLSHQARKIHRVLRLLSTDARWARFRSRPARPCSAKDFGSLLSGVFHAPYPNTYRGVGRRFAPNTPPTMRLRTSKTNSSSASSIREDVAANLHRADSGRRRLRSRARRISAGDSQRICRKHGILLDRGRSAVRHGPHRQMVGRAITPASSRTSSAWRRESPPACRSAP